MGEGDRRFMRRRGYLFFVSVLLSLALVPPGRADTIDLKLAHFMPVMHIQHQKSLLPFARKVEQLTGGRIKVKIFPGGTLGDAAQLADAVKSGITDIAFIVPTYTTGRFPRSAAFDLPFLFDDALHATKGYYDLYDEHIADDFKDYKVLWLLSCGPGQFHSVKKPIQTLEDLKGMKMRSPSAPMSRAFTLWGANPVSMPLPELHGALEKNILDGMLTPASAITDFKLTEIIRHVTKADVYISVMAVIMNKEKFNALPDYAKKALEEAGGKPWGLASAQAYDDHDADTLRKLAAAGKVKVYTLPAGEKRVLAERVKVMETDWITDNARKGIPAESLLRAIHRSAEKNR
jgi:TRAP-type C4-dicarboxylate transport system substrate-binding protein